MRFYYLIIFSLLCFKVTWRRRRRLGPIESENSDLCLEATNPVYTPKGDGKYVLDGYEYTPTIQSHPGDHVESYDGTPCSGVPVVLSDTTVMVYRFDVWNIYEMFHSLLNTYVLITTFDLSNPTILFVDGGPVSKLNDDMFGVFSTNLVYGDAATCYRFKNGSFKSSAEFTSLLVTKHGPLKGRGVDHHCRSAILRSFVNMVKRHFDAPYDDFNVRKSSKVIWSSRGMHSRGDNKNYSPTRSVLNEREMVDELSSTTNKAITIVDFGKLTAGESVRLVSDSDYMIGVHGAGLMWSAFLPRHSVLVEIFGGDRGSNNRHYHNLASLSDLHYYEIEPGALEVVGRNLRWRSGDRSLIDKISSSLTTP